jgi:hypothetical protein
MSDGCKKRLSVLFSAVLPCLYPGPSPSESNGYSGVDMLASVSALVTLAGILIMAWVKLNDNSGAYDMLFLFRVGSAFTIGGLLALAIQAGK